MMISRSNYEIFFVDYLDGRLSESQKVELFDFLEANPDLKEELTLFSGGPVEADKSIVFSEKSKLKRQSVSLVNYKTWLAAYFENDLSGDQKEELEDFLSRNPIAKRELEVLKLTRILPDHRIIFSNKNKLRKGRLIYMTPSVRSAVAVAASLLIFAIAYFLVKENTSTSPVISKIERSVEDKSEKINHAEVASSEKTEITSSVLNNGEGKNEYKKSGINGSNKKHNVPHSYLAHEEKPAPDTIRVVEPQPPVAVIRKDSTPLRLAQTILPQVQMKVTVLPQRNLADVFTDEDLKELGITEQTANKNVSTLVELAANEIQRISKTSEISFERHNQDSSITYALAVGKNFSVSHTRMK